MDVKQRVRMCKMVEKIKAQEEYSRRIGIADASTFRGELIRGNQKIREHRN